MWNHYVVHMKLILYVKYTSIFKIYNNLKRNLTHDRALWPVFGCPSRRAFSYGEENLSELGPDDIISD